MLPRVQAFGAEQLTFLSRALLPTSRRFKPVSARLSYHADKARLGEGIYAQYGPATKSGALDAALKDAGTKGGACVLACVSSQQCNL